MGRKEKSLEHISELSYRSAAFRTYSHRRHSVRSKLYRALCSRYVTARLRKTAARILYKRTHYKVRAECRRLFRITKLSVAVVDGDVCVCACLYEFYYLAYFFSRKRGSCLIPFRALDKDDFKLVADLLYLLRDGVVVGFSVFEFDVFICNAEIVERAVAVLRFISYHVGKRVIGATRNGKHCVSRS